MSVVVPHAALLDLAADAIFARDLQRRIIYWNRGAESTYGWSRQEALGAVAGELLQTEYPIPLLEIEQIVRDTGEWDGDLAQHTKDGRRLVVLSRWGAQRDDEGRVTAMLEINRDITMRRQARAERERLRRDAERERVRSRLSRAHRMESLGQLAGGVAHDFNNLLAVIINYSAFVADHLQAAIAQETTTDSLRQARADIEQVRDAAKQAAHLTGQLLAFARRDENKPERVDVNATITAFQEMLRRTLGGQVELQSALTEDLAPVMFDRGHMEQILLNLAVNARDAMPEGGLLRIDTANADIDEHFASSRPGLRPGPHVRLRVSDTGQGMSPEVLERAFEPFFTTKPQDEGTGLGLATVYGIVRQAGGYVQIYSEQGVGTTLTMLLPSSGAGEQPTGQPAATSQTDPPGQAATILLVEDTTALRELTRRILANGGHRVLEAAGATQALDIAEGHEGPIDLLLSDVVMPVMHGHLLAERIRVHRPDIAVLLMSGFAQSVLERDGHIDDDMPLIDKPFTDAELLAAVASQLATPHGEAERPGSRGWQPPPPSTQEPA